MSDEQDNRRSPVEPAEITEIRAAFDFHRGLDTIEIHDLLDHIDALTAERDALRVAVEEARDLFARTDTYSEWVANRIELWASAIDPLLDNSPSEATDV